jgi:hypothetical protein
MKTNQNLPIDRKVKIMNWMNKSLTKTLINTKMKRLLLETIQKIYFSNKVLLQLRSKNYEYIQCVNIF